MACTIEVLFTPAEFAALSQRDLTRTVCVVFDVLRATSTIVTALANGAAGVIPAVDVPEALASKRRQPEALLAGERQGLRITAALAGGVEFDLGNSPREFTAEIVRGKTIVMTTTNGTRALRACAHARMVLLGSFLNLRATADFVAGQRVSSILLVCAGTGDGTALEDILGAGALCGLLAASNPASPEADSAQAALRLYRACQNDLPRAVGQSRNARRLLALPELREDVPACLRRDCCPLVATQASDGLIQRLA